MKKYDYIIIGGGPTGLTLAYLLSKNNYSVGLFEKENYLGGCHSVHRVNGLFSEHGPRIYINNYLMFQELLKEFGTSFDNLFTEYNFGLSDSIKEAYNNLTIREMFILGVAFIFLNDSYKKISLQDFCTLHNFSPKAQIFLDRIGRLTDGGGADKYTFYSFLQILNQNSLYTIYQPKLPNDIGLFAIWENVLKKNNVDIFLNSSIERLIYDNDIKGIQTKTNNYYADTFILAVPPYSLKNLNLNYAFGDNFNKWAYETNYMTYIPVTFHWKQKLDLPKIWGLPKTSWGVGHIVLSNYTDFQDSRSQTVISSLVTMIDTKSDFLNKTANEISDKNILVNEVFRQLKDIYKDLPNPDYSLMTQNYYNTESKKWEPRHTAFMTTKMGYLKNQSNKFKNLYNCGVQNGLSSYSFTSLESSIVNAIELFNELVPDKKIKIKNAFTVRELLFIILLLILFIFYWKRS